MGAINVVFGFCSRIEKGWRPDRYGRNPSRPNSAGQPYVPAHVRRPRFGRFDVLCRKPRSIEQHFVGYPKPWATTDHRPGDSQRLCAYTLDVPHTPWWISRQPVRWSQNGPELKLRACPPPTINRCPPDD